MGSRFDNNIRGPTSALTEYLRTTGITATTIARRVATQQQNPEGDNAQGRRPRARRSTTNTEYDSDGLDEPESPPKKQKLSKATAAKLKAKAKAKKDEDADYDDDDEDNYAALSKSLWTSPSKKLKIGSLETCAKCEKEFTVTKYTLADRSGDGFLCHPCGKATGNDPFKKPAAPRKRKAASEKRNVTKFEERRIPTLLSLCVEIVSKHIDDIEAFGDIGAMNMTAISKAISKNRSLTSQNAQLFYGAENQVLTFYDATQLAPEAFITLGQLNPNLTTLRLDFCGRITDPVLDAWQRSLPNLTSLTLLGPFLVRPPAWISFFKSHPKLEEFLITQSPRFDLECIQTLVDHCPNLRKLGLKEIGKMSDDFLVVLKALERLVYLDISDPSASCSDDGVIDMLSVVGPTLTELNVSNHALLGDEFLDLGLKSCTEHLTSLNISHLPGLTSEGVIGLFEEWPNLALSVLNISRNPDLSSEAFLAILKHSGESLQDLNINGWKDLTNEALSSIPSTCKQLSTVDLGWCREVDDFVIRELIRNCSLLKTIKVWGCNRVEGRWKLGTTKNASKVYGVENEVITVV